ncbi:MAG: hypothetical protein AB7U98_13765 [Candidatus Nitrosocosmicus sp.]
MKKNQEPTLISRIEEALAKADDFMTSKMIAAATGIHSSRVRSILNSMRIYYKAFDCIEQDKALWWFATPETDTRTKHVDLRVPEGPGHRGGGSKRTLKKMEAKNG